MKSIVDRPKKFDELVTQIPIENLFNLLQMGSWKLNFLTNNLFCSPETLVLLGFSKNHQITLDGLLKLVHSDDVQKFEQFTNRVDRSLKRDLEFRFHHHKRSIIWLRAVAEVSFDLEAKPSELLGVVSDISSQKEKGLVATYLLREKLERAHEAVRSSSRLAAI